MRITEAMRIAESARALTANSERLYGLQRVASTGVRVGSPSDGPAAYASIVRRSERIARLESRNDMLARAGGDLQIAESTLAEAGDILKRARELAVQMADGTWNAGDRADAAKEVALLRQALVGLANTKGQRGFLFGGTDTDTPPFTSAGAFVGNDETMSVEIADGQLAAANVSGQQAFTALSGGVDVFAELTALEMALNTNNAAGVQATIATIDQGHEQVVRVRADAGLRMARFQSAGDVVSGALALSRQVQAGEREGDINEVFSELANAQSAYERSLAVTRQVLSMASAVERF